MYALFYISTTLSYFSIADRVGHIFFLYTLLFIVSSGWNI